MGRENPHCRLDMNMNSIPSAVCAILLSDSSCLGSLV